MKPRPEFPSTLKARAESLAAAWPEESKARIGFRSNKDVRAFLENELGCLDVLEKPSAGPNGPRIATAPRTIYHLCASNIDVSSETSLFLGLLLGSRLFFKLPGEGLPGFESLLRGLPELWAARVDLLRDHDMEVMRTADAVVLFGSDATIKTVHAQTRPGQRILVYGHRISAGLVLPGCATSEWAERAAMEIAAYRQGGCLSPRLYLCPTVGEAGAFADFLADALRHTWKIGDPGFAAASAILAARDQALLQGHRLITPGTGAGWTVELATTPVLDPGPGEGYIRIAPHPDPWTWLCAQPVLSALSITQNPLEASWLTQAAETGLACSRLCPTGKLQQPPLDWPHDGRPRLADLLRWISLETS